MWGSFLRCLRIGPRRLHAKGLITIVTCCGCLYTGRVVDFDWWIECLRSVKDSSHSHALSPFPECVCFQNASLAIGMAIVHDEHESLFLLISGNFFAHHGGWWRPFSRVRAITPSQGHVVGVACYFLRMVTQGSRSTSTCCQFLAVGANLRSPSENMFSCSKQPRGPMVEDLKYASADLILTCDAPEWSHLSQTDALYANITHIKVKLTHLTGVIHPTLFTLAHFKLIFLFNG